ncbi:hypothetical protein [Cellulosimicrobium sp. RS]|uniref:hypothetical protein n=1 Tax=Cellulosimicrobium sp. RS TaxID=3381347 RepID=UPI0038FC9D1C
MNALKRNLMVAVLVVAAVLGIGGASTASPAPAALPAGPASDTLCQLLPEGVAQTACKGVGSVVDPTNPGGVVDAGGLVGALFEGFTAKNLMQEWAVGTAIAAAKMLDGMQSLLLNLSRPNLRADWFLSHYGVMWALGLIVMAFVLVPVATKLGAAGDARRRPEVVASLREAGVRAVFFMPAVMLLPTLVWVLSQLSYRLAAIFGGQSTEDAAAAVKWFVDVLAKTNDPESVMIGGSMSLLVLGAIAYFAAFTATVEMVIASYGLYLVLLLGPVLLALAIHPRFRKLASIAGTVLASLLLVPPIIFFGFWVLWGMVGGALDASSPTDAFRGVLLIGIGTLAVVALPVLVGIVTSMVVGSSTGDDLGSATRSVNHGAVGVGQKLAQGMQKLGGARGGSTGGSGAGAGRGAVPAGAMTAATGPGGQGDGPGAAATSQKNQKSKRGEQSAPFSYSPGGGAVDSTAGAGAAVGAKDGPVKGAQTGAQMGKAAGPKGMAAGAAIGGAAGAVGGPAEGAIKGTQSQLKESLERGRHVRDGGEQK